MSNQNNRNGEATASLILGIALLLGSLGVVWYAGTIAWSWTEPESFNGAIMFIFWWSTLAFVGEMILYAIITAIGSATDS